MTRRGRREPASGEYKVGYGRPPVGTRFQPGQSGNPEGRRKGLQQPRELLLKQLSKRVSASDSGQRRTMTLLEVIIRNIVAGAASRDAKSVALVIKLLEGFGAMEPVAGATAAPTVTSAEDAKILQAYLADYQVQLAAGADTHTNNLIDRADHDGGRDGAVDDAT